MSAPSFGATFEVSLRGLMMTWPSHALRRTQPLRSGGNPHLPRAGSLNLGRYAQHGYRRRAHSEIATLHAAVHSLFRAATRIRLEGGSMIRGRSLAAIRSALNVQVLLRG